MSELSGQADLIEHAIGYRAWRQAPGGWLRSTGVGRTAWRTGVNSATCAFAAHGAPASDCTCGLYALHEPPPAALPGVVGAVRAHGRLEVHEKGFRAEHAEIVALAHPGGQPGRARRAAARYGVPLVALEHLEALAREHGRPIPPGLRPQSRWSAVAGLARRAYLRGALPLRRVPRLRAVVLFALAYAPLVTFVAWGYLLSSIERHQAPRGGSLLLAVLPATLGLTAHTARRTLGSGSPLPSGGSVPALLALAAPLEVASQLGAHGHALNTAAWTIGLVAVGLIATGLVTMRRPLHMVTSLALLLAVAILVPAAGGDTVVILAAAGLLRYAVVYPAPFRPRRARREDLAPAARTHAHPGRWRVARRS